MLANQQMSPNSYEDNPLPPEFIERLVEMAERCLDLDGLTKLGFDSAQPPVQPPVQPPTQPPVQPPTQPPVVQPPTQPPVQPPNRSLSGVEGNRFQGSKVSRRVSGVEPRIAVARDAAFCFVYEDNLRLLREAGVEVVTFSPMEDKALPADISGIYLPGGYPELYAERLAANSSLKIAIRSAVAADMPVYAECGGFVYLTEGIDESEGRPSADFAGIFPVRCRMLPRRKALGYRQVELLHETVIGSSGIVCRGHEFHYSKTGAMPDKISCNYNVSRQGIMLGTEGYSVQNCLASYIHLHFGSNPEIAPALVEVCRQFIRKRALNQET